MSFSEQIRKKVYKTINDYDLILPSDKLIVAVSGGKDSMSLMHLLKDKFNITALFIDVGIPNFSKESFQKVKYFCDGYGIPLKKVSLKEVVGFTTPEAVEIIGGNACTTCSVLKRYAINKSARGYDKIATGHNLDDEAESVLMNIFKSNKRLLLNTGPKTGLMSDKKFVQRVKPLYFIPEKDVLEYAVINKLPFVKHPCPMRGESPFRYFIKKQLDKLEKERPNVKLNIIKSFLTFIKKEAHTEKEEIHYCKYCGEPSSSDVCNACKIRLEIEHKIKLKK